MQLLSLSALALLGAAEAFSPSALSPSALKARSLSAAQPLSLRPTTFRHSATQPLLRAGLRNGPSTLMMAASMVGSPVAMPALSSTMKEGKIVQWTKSVGDKVDAGDILMVVESDKADMDVESFEEGYLAKILVNEGEAAEVGSTVAIIVPTVEDIAKVGDVTAAPAAPAAEEPAPAAPAAEGPPSTSILMPALSSTMKEGKIVQWAKSEGEMVEAGDIVMVVESDKADMDVESFESGYLAKILVEEGGAAAVGAPVALLVDNKDDIGKVSAPAAAAAAPAAPAPAAAAPAPAPAAAPKAASPSAPAASGDRVVASPLAKALAAEKGVDISTITGTGPEGRITSSDVENAIASGTAGKSADGPKIPSIIPPGTVVAGPSAKKAAKQNGIDLKTVKGTGLFGRVTEEDVLMAAGKAPAAAAASGPKPVPTREIPELPDGPVALSGMQVAVANNMDATVSVPVFRTARKIRTDKFDELYAKLKPKGVTVSALLSKAVALALEAHPIINAHYDAASRSIVYHKDINVANAVALDGGLITPTLKNANEMDILSLSAEWKSLVGKAKAGSLRPDEFQSGTFTVSNLGMFGVSQFGAILPPGTGAILAIGGANPTVKMVNGVPTEVKEMEVTLTADHRHIYGADSAMFLKTLAEILEENTLDLVMN